MSLRQFVRRPYVRWVRPRIKDPLTRQRVKLLWFGWGYLPMLLRLPGSIRTRLWLVKRFLRIDWNVLHAHEPREISEIAIRLAQREARPGEVMVEAGCWQGGSTAKFSILCAMTGLGLHVFDSFEGVEAMSPEALRDSYDFSHEYAAPETVVRQNVERYGRLDVCQFHRGWFAETLAVGPLPYPVRVAYIDCDVAKGTREALIGVTGPLVPDGCIFSQDCHLPPVRAVLEDGATWRSLGRAPFSFTVLTTHLGILVPPA